MLSSTQKFTVGQLMINWSTYNLEPDYQRQSNIWSSEKRAYFIDTLFMKLDVPKFYFHKLVSADPFFFAVVDGKQRLSTIRDFYLSQFPVPEFLDLPSSRRDYPADRDIKGKYFKDLSEEWKEWFKAINLDIVIIETEGDDVVEDLFERLNNGSPLNAAELRNAKPGRMSELIREFAGADTFFVSDRLRGAQDKRTSEFLDFANKRFAFNDLVAKLLFLHENNFDLDVSINKQALDDLVIDNAALLPDEIQKRAESLRKGLRRMERVFGRDNKLLTKALAHIYYSAINQIFSLYAHPDLSARALDAFEKFEVDRELESRRDEDVVPRNISDFNKHVQQNTGSSTNMRPLVNILVAEFVSRNPDVSLKDKRRDFTYNERKAIWLRAGKKCQQCDRPLSLDEMHADHIEAHSNGGETSIANAQCLCVEHNLAKSDS
jgi:hypothetical protein